MLSFRSNTSSSLLLLLLVCFFISASCSSSSHGVDSPIPGDVEKREPIWRRLLEGGEESSKTNKSSETLVLAAERTHRRDPLDGFKYYTGGWNIYDKHYLSSAAFTAAPLFVAAVVWLLGYGVFVCCMCLCCCCRSEKGSSSSAAGYCISLVFLILFTVIAVVAILFLYTGEERFYNSTTKVLEYVVGQAKDVIDKLSDFRGIMDGIKKAGGQEVSLPEDELKEIDSVDGFIGYIINEIQFATDQVDVDVKQFVLPIRWGLILGNAVLLLLILLGLLFSICGCGWLVYCIVPVTWILIAGTFLMGGVFLLVHTAVADTCVAIEEWRANPTADSALKSIFPAANETYVRDITRGTRNVTFSLVNGTNNVISGIFNADMPPSAGQPFYYNQSGPLVPLLCNPYNVDLTDRKCQPGELDLHEAPQEWKKHVCEVSLIGMCITPGRITPDNYKELTSTVDTTYGLYKYGPFLADMASYAYVKDTFSNITTNHCPDMSVSTEWTYTGYALVATSVMLSMILWMVNVRQCRLYKKYKKLEKKKKKNQSPAPYYA